LSLLFFIKAKGADVAAKRLTNFQKGLIRREKSILKDMGEEVVGRSREDYLSGPRPKKLGRVSGNLARTLYYRVNRGRVDVGSKLPYAPVHEFGATIRATRAPFLRFKTRDGMWHSKKKVKIPARPFLRPALADALSKGSLRSILLDHIAAAMRTA